LKPIADRSIWLEDLTELMIRWYEKQPDQIQVQAVSPQDTAARIRKRANRVIEFSHLTLPRQIKNSREWETRWEPKARWNALTSALDQLGYDAIVQEDHPTGASVRLSALHESDRESIVLVRSTIQEIRQNCLNLGLTIEITERDIALYQLALEFYYLQTPRMGNLPRPWVDELAAHCFAQQVLGVPFNLLVLELSEAT
jgi:hypothetical protein